jgi:pimeloyl-ACP methyl ester carboxylesterase
MSTTIVNGVRLFYQLSGTAGEPVVLVHGSWIDHHNWDAVIPSLSQGFRVLAYDRRGHSQSERPVSFSPLSKDVADLAALIEALQLAPAHVVGHSMGGSIALRLAGERPDLIRSLVVHEPPLIDLLPEAAAGQPGPGEFKAQIAAVVDLLEAGQTEAGVRQFVETIIFGPGAWEQIPAEIRQTVLFNAPTFLEETRDPSLLSLDLPALRRYTGPVLLTLADDGPPFFRPIIERLAQALPQAERKVFAGTGHEPEYTHPDAYVATVSTFFAAAAGVPSVMAKESVR